MALLVEGAILAVIVVWFFLREWRRPRRVTRCGSCAASARLGTLTLSSQAPAPARR